MLSSWLQWDNPQHIQQSHNFLVTVLWQMLNAVSKTDRDFLCLVYIITQLFYSFSGGWLVDWCRLYWCPSYNFALQSWYWKERQWRLAVGTFVANITWYIRFIWTSKHRETAQDDLEPRSDRQIDDNTRRSSPGPPSSSRFISDSVEAETLGDRGSVHMDVDSTSCKWLLAYCVILELSLQLLLWNLRLFLILRSLQTS